LQRSSTLEKSKDGSNELSLATCEDNKHSKKTGKGKQIKILSLSKKQKQNKEQNENKTNNVIKNTKQ